MRKFVYVAFSGMDMAAAASNDPNNQRVNPWFGFRINARWYPGLEWHGRDPRDVAAHEKGVPIKEICTTRVRFDRRDTSWQGDVINAVNESSCMIVLMGKVTTGAEYKYVKWEIGCAISKKIPVYVMKRNDQQHRWANDGEILDFLDLVSNQYRKYGRLKVWPRVDSDRFTGFKGWDPNTWVYPQMSHFLDNYAKRR